MSWTQDQINLMIKMANEGYSSTQISNIINKTRNAVVGKCRRLGVQLKGKIFSRKSSVRVYPKKLRKAKTMPKPPKAIIAPKPKRPPRITLTEDDFMTYKPEPTLYLRTRNKDGTKEVHFPDKHCCRYIYGEMEGYPRWCGTPTKDEKSSWCQYHHELIYRKLPPRKYVGNGLKPRHARA